MRIAITGTTSGIGLALKSELCRDHTIVDINRLDYDLNLISDLEKINLSGIDILINNAGHANGGGNTFVTHKVDDYFRILDTNLRAPIYLTQKFINQNASGKVIFITSRCVEKNIGGDSVYAASKSGLSTFIDCLRDELSSEYKLIEIRPGRTKTNFPEARGIYTPEVIKSFYDSRMHLTVNHIVEVVKFAINNDTIEKFTINKK
jgi:NADP-dependent 3-hydroxy acid dehydrogenase YdfG